VQRQKMKHVALPVRFSKMTVEVEEGFTEEQTRNEVERCLNCDVQTHFTDSLCIECDACIDICPTDCLTLIPAAEGAESADPKAFEASLRAQTLAPATNLDQPLFHSSPLKQTARLMVKDENVCLHCGLCAERCPTYAWDMRKFVVEIPYAGTAFVPLAAVGR
jgi:formate dehydrogenase beta subunit